VGCPPTAGHFWDLSPRASTAAGQACSGWRRQESRVVGFRVLARERGVLYCEQPDLMVNWLGTATLAELGPPIRIGLPLGFRPNPTGGASAIYGVQQDVPPAGSF
jgi:hypothetical protein